jgi:hypothetical protein
MVNMLPQEKVQMALVVHIDSLNVPLSIPLLLFQPFTLKFKMRNS